jgi:hypothetical protein
MVLAVLEEMDTIAGPVGSVSRFKNAEHAARHFHRVSFRNSNFFIYDQSRNILMFGNGF